MSKTYPEQKIANLVREYIKGNISYEDFKIDLIQMPRIRKIDLQIYILLNAYTRKHASVINLTNL